MFLKELRLTHFRKFDEANNKLQFTSSQEAAPPRNNKNHLATDTTLIVGKNNAGKTTVIQALRRLSNPNLKICAADFNFTYLHRLLSSGFSGKDSLPYIEFGIVIGLNSDGDDLTHLLADFMTLGTVAGATDEIDIIVRYEITDSASFLHKAKAIKDLDEAKQFDALLDLLNSQNYEPIYKNAGGWTITSFRFAQLVELCEIAAYDVKSANCLSPSFNKILRHQRNQLIVDSPEKKTIDDNIESMNDLLSDCLDNLHGRDINAILSSVVLGAELEARLNADITLEKICNSLVRYEYGDSGFPIPEDQFGLGYTRLIMVIAHLLDFVDRHDEACCRHNLSLLVIEEPEVHMHPQMQELFIQYIDDVVGELIAKRNKSINCQIIITTHSDHIVHSKIHSSQKFNCINYLRSSRTCSSATALTDKKASKDGKLTQNELLFLKKHIRLSTTSIFFADAVVLVEGLAETILLPYFLSKEAGLRNYYVSIISVNGAHAKVYEGLLSSMGIPTVIITDLDIKRTGSEKTASCTDGDMLPQMTDISARETTNRTLIHFAGTSLLSKMKFPLEANGGLIKVFAQTETEGFYPTSLEEALILSNSDSAILHKAMSDTKPKLLEGIPGEDKAKALMKNSYHYYRKISDKKSEFAGNILYNLCISPTNSPDNAAADAFQPPEYIQSALASLAQTLKESRNA